MILDRLPVPVLIAIGVAVVFLVVGIAIGIVSAVRRGAAGSPTARPG